jgi:hypothetical protein
VVLLKAFAAAALIVTWSHQGAASAWMYSGDPVLFPTTAVIDVMWKEVREWSDEIRTEGASALIGEYGSGWVPYERDIADVGVRVVSLWLGIFAGSIAACVRSRRASRRRRATGD